MGERTLIILHRFTRPRFDDAMVVRSIDWAFTRLVDFGGKLGPCCLRVGEVTGHGGSDTRNDPNMYEEYIYIYYHSTESRKRPDLNFGLNLSHSTIL